MLKPISAAAAAVAIVATFSFATAVFAQCDSCGTGDASFGYPGSSCSGCASGGHGHGLVGGRQHGEVLRAKFEHAKQINDKVSARNEAWPKPFTCADRQLYAAFWRPMVEAGFADQNTITAVHFNKDHTLTKYGQQQIAGIMKNMPQARKVVFLQECSDEETTRSRYNEIQKLVTQWYGQQGRVALTSRNPINQTGLRAEGTFNNYYEAMAPPIIPVANGTTSVGDSVGN